MCPENAGGDSRQTRVADFRAAPAFASKIETESGLSLPKTHISDKKINEQRQILALLLEDQRFFASTKKLSTIGR